ncbi:Tic22 family protein [Trifolium repens]|nr:Tic22 family protein [Trifolium repens]
MTQPSEPHRRRNNNHISSFLQSTASNFLSLYAENLDIAKATTDGIKWYTPYFFDKHMLDNILEEAVDQQFHTLIQTRRIQQRQDVVDDNLVAEVVEETTDSLGEPPEV